MQDACRSICRSRLQARVERWVRNAARKARRKRTRTAFHHIIEARPNVLAHMRATGWFDKPRVTVLEGTWQSQLPLLGLVQRGVSFDCVLCDTFETLEDVRVSRPVVGEGMEEGGRVQRGERRPRRARARLRGSRHGVGRKCRRGVLRANRGGPTEA